MRERKSETHVTVEGERGREMEAQRGREEERDSRDGRRSVQTQPDGSSDPEGEHVC